MANPNPTDRSSFRAKTPIAEDTIIESAVLGFVLEEHPAHVTIPELSLAMNRGRKDFSANEAVEQAISDLVGAGLLYIGGGLVLPTRAALFFHDLEVG